MGLLPIPLYICPVTVHICSSFFMVNPFFSARAWRRTLVAGAGKVLMTLVLVFCLHE